MNHMKALIYIFKNYYRKKCYIFDKKIEKFIPELSGTSKIFVPLSLLSHCVVFILPIVVDLSHIVYIENLLNEYLIEIVSLFLMLHFVTLRRFLSYHNEQKYTDFFGIDVMIVYLLLENEESLFTWLLLQSISFSIFKEVYIFFLCPLSCLGLFLAIRTLLVYPLHKTYIQKTFLMIIAFSFITAIGFFLQKNTGWHFRLSEAMYRGFVPLLTLIAMMLGWNLFLSKWSLMWKLLYNPFKVGVLKGRIFYIPILSFITLSTIVLFTSMFGDSKKIEPLLFLASYLISSLVYKTKYIRLMSFESFGPFLFYLKQTNPAKGREILRKMERNNYLLLMPILIYHAVMFVICCQILFLPLLVCVFIADVELDHLIVMVFPRIVGEEQLKNLRVHSVKGLSTAILTALVMLPVLYTVLNHFQIATQGLNLHFSHNVSFHASLLVIFVIIIITIFLIKSYWFNSFFEDLYKI